MSAARQISASVAAERWRSTGAVRGGGGGGGFRRGEGGNKKEIGLLLCEPGALRLIQSQRSVQQRLGVSWV